MKITHFSLARLRVPLKTPFKTALRTVAAAESLVFSLHTDTGEVGHGDAVPTLVITGDSAGSIHDALSLAIGPRLIGLDTADLNLGVQRIQSALHGNTSAKAAAEIALYDLWAQRHAAPLHHMLGGGPGQLHTDITISLNPMEVMLADTEAALAQGFTALKIKLGQDTQADIARVQAIHAAVAGRALLRLDANQGWEAKQAVRIMRALEDAGITLDLLEQPVKAQDIHGLKYVSDNIHTPVLADESVFSPQDALRLIQLRAADILNIKLMKTGGISRALHIADLAQLHGMSCMIGCMIETSISTAAAAHLAAAHSACITRVDLDAPALCQFDPVEGGTCFDAASIQLNTTPGLGIRHIRGLEPVPDISPSAS